MVMDLYAAAMWEASGREPVREARGQIRIFLPHWQRRRIIEAEAFERLDAVRDARIYREELLERASELVIVARTSALSELENTGVLLDADAVWSMWPGYLEGEAVDRAGASCAATVSCCTTSTRRVTPLLPTCATWSADSVPGRWCRSTRPRPRPAQLHSRTQSWMTTVSGGSARASTQAQSAAAASASARS